MSQKKTIPQLPFGEGSMYMYNDDLIAYKKSIKLKNGKKKQKVVYAKTAAECMKKMQFGGMN